MRRTLGNTNIQLFPIGLGAMPLSIHASLPLASAVKVIHAAIEEGLNFIDTANVYCTDDQDIGLNERTIAKALESVPREDIVVASKGGLVRPQGRWERRGSPQHLRSACDESLQDLGVETITLYQLHAPDPLVPFSDSVGELARLQSEGKILHLGLSNVNQQQLDEALRITTIQSVQNRCNVFHTADLNNGLVEYCQKNAITYIAYSPMCGGGGHAGLVSEKVLANLAEVHETTVYQIVLAWLLKKSNSILPIPGASRISSAVSSAHAIHVELSNEDVAHIDSIGTK